MSVRDFTRGAYRQNGAGRGSLTLNPLGLGYITSRIAARSIAQDAQKQIDARHARLKEPKKVKPSPSPYSDDQVLECLRLWRDGYKVAALSRKLNIPVHTIYMWTRGANRAHLLKQVDDELRNGVAPSASGETGSPEGVV